MTRNKKRNEKQNKKRMKKNPRQHKLKTVAQLKQLHTHAHTLRLIMICIDHDDVLPTYERQLPSCPPTHKVNLQTDTGCALRGAGDSLSVHARRADTLAIYAKTMPCGGTCLSHQFTPCLFLQDIL